LHGFASTPLSTKAQFFKSRLPMDILQIDGGDFQSLTITGQLAVVDAAVHGDRVILMGSSLGGYVAALYAVRHANVERLVLLAPALAFPKRWRDRFTASEMEQWRKTGARMFYHYGYKEERALGYQFVEDALNYEDDPDFHQPALIFHGLRDDVVPASVSREFAAGHSNVELRLVDSGHELTDVLDFMWEETARFLGYQNR
jgi:uncharacterized protein